MSIAALAPESPAERTAPQALTQSAKEKLRQLVARIEKLEEEKRTLANDVKDTYGEAKGMGYDTKVLRQVIAWRRRDAQEREEQDEMRDLYLHALGDV